MDQVTLDALMDHKISPPSSGEELSSDTPSSSDEERQQTNLKPGNKQIKKEYSSSTYSDSDS